MVVVKHIKWVNVCICFFFNLVIQLVNTNNFGGIIHWYFCNIYLMCISWRLISIMKSNVYSFNSCKDDPISFKNPLTFSIACRFYRYMLSMFTSESIGYSNPFQFIFNAFLFKRLMWQISLLKKYEKYQHFIFFSKLLKLENFMK